jgi:uncharacterized membrane protein YdbT with pleckstrin-like domain
MGYIEKTLGGEEALIAKASFHWLYHVFAYGMLVLSLALAGYMYSQASWPGWAAIVASVGIAVFLRVMVAIWTTEIGVTSDRVIVKRRFLARHTDEIQLSAIEEINVDQGLFGRLLGFGRITLQGTGDDDVDIPAIASPLRFRRSIQQALENMRPTAVSKGSSRARF